MLKKSKNLLIIIFLINSINFYCQNKKTETFLVGFKVDCLIEKKPFFESQTVYLTDIENNSEGNHYIFYSNGNKYKVKTEFLNVTDSIKNVLNELSSIEKDSLISKSKSKSFLIDELDKDLAQSTYENIKNKVIALSFYSYFDNDIQEIIGKRLYFNLTKKTITKIKLKANGYDEYGTYLGSKTMIQNQIIKPKESFKFNPISWSNPNLYKIDLNEVMIEYSDGTKTTVQDKNIPSINYHYLYLLFGNSALLKN